MFERLFDLITQLWARLAPAEIVDAYEGGVVLRFGKFARIAEPGLRWKWPIVERIFLTNTCVVTHREPPQTLTTKDQVSVVVSVIVKYQVKDVRPFLLEIGDSVDVLLDVTAYATKHVVSELTAAELFTQDAEQMVLERVRKEVNQYGFKIHKVTFADCGKVPSIRLMMQEHVHMPQ